MLLAAVVAAMTAAGVGLAYSTSSTDAGGAPPAEGQTNTGPGAGGQPRATTPASANEVRTTLTPTGFAPAQAREAAGRVNLRVKNRSGEREVTLSLTNADGVKVTEARLTDKVKEWVVPVELPPGNYVLSEANHPDWTCRVEVTDR